MTSPIRLRGACQAQIPPRNDTCQYSTPCHENWQGGIQPYQQADLCDGLTEIGQEAFGSCDSIKKIQIPRTVAIIREKAFHQCSLLREVTLPSDGVLECIENEAFLGCNSLLRIAIPSTVTRIGPGAFHDCTQLVYYN